jgi:hypothetical protein
MASFARWYIGKLKAAPMTTNMTSALVLMVVGDVTAQGLEIHYFRKEEDRKHDDADIIIAASSPSLLLLDPCHSQRPKLRFHRYGTMTPDLHEIKQDLSRRQTTIDHTYRQLKTQTDSHTMSKHWLLTLESSLISLQSTMASLDFFRIGMMSFWATAVVTPFFVSFYRLMDRYLPQGRTFAAVGSRVMGSFVSSIPLNTAFFCYGTLVHHTMEWWSLIQEWRNEVPEANLKDIMAEEPFDAPMLISTTKVKLETELLRTLQASATIWIPINSFNFYFAPPHIRPLVLMIFSAFWNCYLSLAQHRDAHVLV